MRWKRRVAAAAVSIKSTHYRGMRVQILPILKQIISQWRLSCLMTRSGGRNSGLLTSSDSTKDKDLARPCAASNYWLGVKEGVANKMVEK